MQTDINLIFQVILFFFLTTLILFVFQLLNKKKSATNEDGDPNKAIADHLRSQFENIYSESEDSTLEGDKVARRLTIGLSSTSDTKILIRFILRDLQNWHNHTGWRCGRFTLAIKCSKEQFTAFEKIYNEYFLNTARIKDMQATGCEFIYVRDVKQD